MNEGLESLLKNPDTVMKSSGQIRQLGKWKTIGQQRGGCTKVMPYDSFRVEGEREEDHKSDSWMIWRTTYGDWVSEDGD